jgi:ribonuclease HI
MWFKGHKVWVELNEQGELKLKDKKARLKYNLEQPHEYWVYPGSLGAIDQPPQATKTRTPENKKRHHRHPPSAQRGDTPLGSRGLNDADAIRIFTDGASSGNPGPSGIGALLIYGQKRKEISRFIGHSTNNIAELEAIRAGLAALKTTHLPVKLYTDSSYALGVLTKSWRAKKNRELIERIKRLMSRFKDLEIIKVPGHAGLPENERADQLAVTAIKRGVDAVGESADF